MIAIKIPYPPPQNMSEWVGTHGLQSLDRAIDFPERGLSYVVGECSAEDWQRCEVYVREAVDRHAPGTEPERLNIALNDPAGV
jgi:hypothetical protein